MIIMSSTIPQSHLFAPIAPTGTRIQEACDHGQLGSDLALRGTREARYERRLGQFLGKETSNATPHCCGQHVPLIRFDEVAELSRRVPPGICLFDASEAFLSVLDWTSGIRFAKIQMQRTGSNQARHLGRITVL